jgi:non-lysosomal glucosylceramidase
MSKIPYTHDELFNVGKPRVYTGRQLDEIAFPLGGIGTGMISLGGWGQLRDFEIFNKPEKGLMFNYTFFTLYAKKGENPPVTRVIEGPVGGTYTAHGSGVTRLDGSGLPHFQECKFTGEFPFARLDFNDPKMPLQVTMEAFNPFIPLNDDDSSLPAAIFLFHLSNPTSEPVSAVLFANLENKVGHPDPGKGVIAFQEGENVSGLMMTTKKYEPDSPRFGSLTLTTPWKDLNVQTHWYRGGWFDSLHKFWDQVSLEGQLKENREPAEADDRRTDVGSIGLKVNLKPGEKLTLPVMITWYIPNYEKNWGNKAVWKNYYGTKFSDAFHVAEYIGANFERLENETRLFKNSLFESSLPESVLDAVSSQISILKTTTCLRMPDGTFYGFEGCNPGGGCCEGTCTHVWNYAQALPFLFPTLERSIRNTDYTYNLTDDGHMTFRMPLPLGTMASGGFHAAGDGQMGGILKVYREWLTYGDDEWLRKIWPKVKIALEYAWKQWDADKDGVMEGVQHNTYDIEFHGPNTMMGSFYLGALRAAEEMARHLGEKEKADEYRKVYESGKAWMDKNLFNGEWYRQEVRPGGKQTDVPIESWPNYQYGEGCLSDQLIGQWYARILALGDLFDPEHVKKTMESIFKYNWKSDMSEHPNPQRIYAINDEAGLLLCSWPRGGRPPLPFVYSDEVWCGIEYQVAAHLIYEGFVEEGLSIVKGVRDRHDGARRNPWNEFECGNHYARSMASYSVMLALSGFHYSAPSKHLSFAPCIHEKDFSCFFSVDSGWGMYRQQMGNINEASIKVIKGSLTLKEIGLPFHLEKAKVSLSGKIIPVSVVKDMQGMVIKFDHPVCINAGDILSILS